LNHFCEGTTLGRRPALSNQEAIPMNSGNHTGSVRQYSFLLWASGVAALLGIYLMADRMVKGNNTMEHNITHPAGSVPPPRFHLIDLGTLGGMASSRAINSQGQVAGTSDKPGISAGLIFLWEKGRMQEIGPLPGKTASNAGDINDKGQIVGSAHNGGNPPLDPPQALIYRNGKLEPLFPDSRESSAVGINVRAEVVGQMMVKKNLHHAFLWSNGKVTDLGTLQGGNSSASGINAAGHVVGYSDVGRQRLHAFLWKEGRMHDLGTLGGQGSEAMAINDKDQVVGTADTSEANDHGPPMSRAFLWEGGTMRDLGSPGPGVCSAHAINNRGQVVGDWLPVKLGFEGARALLWEDGKMHDLNDLIPPNSGWVLTGAIDINDQGQIVGVGTYQGWDRAFLLMPE
jgi:probable HAF family extracellular repeat protein